MGIQPLGLCVTEGSWGDVSALLRICAAPCFQHSFGWLVLCASTFHTPDCADLDVLCAVQRRGCARWYGVGAEASEKGQTVWC